MFTHRSRRMTIIHLHPGFEKWLPNWRRNGFISSTGNPVKNVNIIKCLSAHLDARARAGQRIRIQYVKAHNGEEGNEAADSQANIGTTMPEVSQEPDWEESERKIQRRLGEYLDNLARKDHVQPPTVPMEVVEDGLDNGSAIKRPVESPTNDRKVERAQVKHPWLDSPRLVPVKAYAADLDVDNASAVKIKPVVQVKNPWLDPPKFVPSSSAKKPSAPPVVTPVVHDTNDMDIDVDEFADCLMSDDELIDMHTKGEW